jgi:hypothetical protein
VKAWLTPASPDWVIAGFGCKGCDMLELFEAVTDDKPLLLSGGEDADKLFKRSILEEA